MTRSEFEKLYNPMGWYINPDNCPKIYIEEVLIEIIEDKESE